MTLLAEPSLGRSGEPGSAQAPGAVVMVRPHHFRPNPQTAADNAFQVPPAACRRAQRAGVDPALRQAQRAGAGPAPGTLAAPPAQRPELPASQRPEPVEGRSPDSTELAARAHAEVTTVAERLTAAGVRVHLFDDPAPDRPDSVFCNNWFTTHADGRLVLHSMHAPNRRREPRADVVEALRAGYHLTDVVDLTAGRPLEGTGAMVLDHDRRVAYVSRSRRADDTALADFCERLGYRPHVVDTADRDGRPIYHTNVMLSLATDYSLVALDAVPDPLQRRRLHDALAERGEVVALSQRQVGEFAANALELTGTHGRFLAMSSRGLRSLTRSQRRTIERHTPVLALDVPTLELAGGSVRCMLARVHLPPR